MFLPTRINPEKPVSRGVDIFNTGIGWDFLGSGARSSGSMTSPSESGGGLGDDSFTLEIGSSNSKWSIAIAPPRGRKRASNWTRQVAGDGVTLSGATPQLCSHPMKSHDIPRYPITSRQIPPNLISAERSASRLHGPGTRKRMPVRKTPAVRVREMLSLSSGISKRRMQAAGYTAAQFESRYRATLQATVPGDAERILLIDDVMTKGSTAAQALHAISCQRPDAAVVVATAGQMIVKEAVVDDRGFKRS